MSDSSDPIKPKSKRGGYRPGAGRKPKVHAPVAIDLGAVVVAAHEATQRRAATAPPQEDHQPIAHTKQDEASDEAREFLRAVMREQGLDPKLRIDAAKALLKTAPAQATGKKEQQQTAAMTAHEGTGWDDLLPPAMAQ
jgi:hypothetical protein